MLAALVVVDHALTELGSSALGLAANISVALFFAISGLVLTRAWDGDLPRFLLRRLVRLWPVFALCLVVGSVLARRLPNVGDFLWVPWPSYDANLLCPPMWSLFIEAWAAPAMPLIVWSARGGAWRTMVCMAGCVAVAILWHPAALDLRVFLSYLVCFVAGAGLSGVTWRSPVLNSAVPQWLGRVSYSLYLTHWLVLRAMTQAFGVAGTVAGVVLAFGVGWVIWLVVERPSIAWSRRVGHAG